MGFTHLAPTWFFGWDIILELSFAVITLMVGLFAFKIYKATSQKQSKYLGISFILISISYFIQSIFNFFIVSKANENICGAIKINSIAIFDAMGIYAHIFFMIIGFALLVFMTFKSDKKRILWLLILTSLLGIYLSANTLYIFFLFSSIYLGFISWHFINNYLRNKQKKTLLTATAFIFLLFGSIHFILAVNHQLYYAIGHVLELFAYILILTNLYLVLKR